MSAQTNQVDGVREVSPAEAARLEVVGRIADLSRGNEIVHVGKPVGSVSGWVGPIFWQVWADRADAPGIVNARFDEGLAETWQFDAALEKAEILALAKDRALTAAHALRLARLAEAQAA